MTLEDIHEVVVVGGSTRIPLVLQEITKCFGKVPHQGLSRTHAVALGAAVLAGTLDGDVKDVLLLDVTPFSLGIETSGGTFVPIIPRNTTIPTKRSVVVSSADRSAKMAIRVYQGESANAEENVFIRAFDLDVSSTRRGGEFEITIDVDANHTIVAVAKNKLNGREVSIRIGAQNINDAVIARSASREVALPIFRGSGSSSRNDASAGVAPKTTQNHIGLGKRLGAIFGQHGSEMKWPWKKKAPPRPGEPTATQAAQGSQRATVETAPDYSLRSILDYWTNLGANFDPGKLFTTESGLSMPEEERDYFQRLVQFGKPAILEIEAAALLAIRAQASAPNGRENINVFGFENAGTLCVAIGCIGGPKAFDALQRLCGIASNYNYGYYFERSMVQKAARGYACLAREDGRAMDVLREYGKKYQLSQMINEVLTLRGSRDRVP